MKKLASSSIWINWLCVVFILLTIVCIGHGEDKISNKYQSNSSNFPYPEKFHVTGNKILDEAGKQVIFRGVNSTDPVMLYFSSTNPQYHWNKYVVWSENHFKNIAAWGANIVRLPIHAAAWRVHGKKGCFKAIDEAIKWAAKYNLYVILEYHSILWPDTGEFEPQPTNGYGELYKTTKAEMVTFWIDISTKYRGNKTVAFYEVLNEPTYPGFTKRKDYEPSVNDWLTWKNFVQEIITAIRKNDPDAVILVGGLNYAYDISYAITHPIAFKNIIYVSHPYPGKNQWGLSWDAAFGKTSQHYPVFATEIGFQSSREPPYQETLYKETKEYPGPYRDAIKKYFEKNKISWTAWSFSPVVNPTLLKNKNYTPNDAGYFFRDWLKKNENT